MLYMYVQSFVIHLHFVMCSAAACCMLWYLPLAFRPCSTDSSHVHACELYVEVCGSSYWLLSAGVWLTLAVYNRAE